MEAVIPPALRASAIASEPGSVPLLQARDGQCRFILRQNPAICCGAPTSEASSWCDCHRAIVYQADAPRKIRVSYR